MLQNSIWPPSAILDSLGEVVGPRTKARSWWLSPVKIFVITGFNNKIFVFLLFSLESPIHGPKIAVLIIIIINLY